MKDNRARLWGQTIWKAVKLQVEKISNHNDNF
jgi:hypothetical protein